MVSEAVSHDEADEADDSDVEEVEDEEIIDTIEDGAITRHGAPDDEDDAHEPHHAEAVAPLDPETLPHETDVAHIAAAEDHVAVAAEADTAAVTEAAPAPRGRGRPRDCPGRRDAARGRD